MYSPLLGEGEPLPSLKAESFYYGSYKDEVHPRALGEADSTTTPDGVRRERVKAQRPTPTFVEDAGPRVDLERTIPWASTETPTVKAVKKAASGEKPAEVATSSSPSHCTHHVHVNLVQHQAAHHHHLHLSPRLATAQAKACVSPSAPCCPPPAHGCVAPPPPTHHHLHNPEDHGIWGARCGVASKPALCGAGVIRFVDDVFYAKASSCEESDPESGSPCRRHHH